ncbi:hypothetical protein HK101_004322, partial [Irineochytrium annulatum]
MTAPRASKTARTASAALGGSSIWRHMPIFQIFAANTDVGKTVLTTALCRGALRSPRAVHYIKPVQTGFPVDSDERHVKTYAPDVQGSTLFTYTEPLSPHLTAIKENRIISDKNLLEALETSIRKAGSTSSAEKEAMMFIETAG